MLDFVLKRLGSKYDNTNNYNNSIVKICYFQNYFIYLQYFPYLNVFYCNDLNVSFCIKEPRFRIVGVITTIVH